MKGLPLVVLTNMVMLAVIVAYTRELSEGRLPDQPDTVMVTMPSSGGSSLETANTVTGETLVTSTPDDFPMVRLVGPLSVGDFPRD